MRITETQSQIGARNEGARRKGNEKGVCVNEGNLIAVPMQTETESLNWSS